MSSISSQELAASASDSKEPGCETVAFCEIDPYCRAVLKRHWPHVPCYDDVRSLTAARLAADGIAVDAVCGGFPCQDISVAGKQAGIDGERSGLWSEYARIIGELRPRYVIVENVAALAFRGLDRVLGDLAAFGYDAEWHCIPASAVGARHRRDRLWIIAHPSGAGLEGLRGTERIQAEQPQPSGNSDVAHPDSRWRRSDATGGDDANRTNTGRSETDRVPRAVRHAGGARHVADATSERRGEARQHSERSTERTASSGATLADTERGGLSARHVRYDEGYPIFFTEGGSARGWDQIGETWRTEPNVGRVAYGVPNAMDRIKGLGNAVVPQVPEVLGRAIMKSISAPTDTSAFHKPLKTLQE